MMKNGVCSGLAVLALLTISACNSSDEAEKPSPANSEEAAELAKGKAGEMPSDPLASSRDVKEPHADGKLATQSASPAAEPPIAFGQCHSCHSVEPGKNGYGPSLAGVFGRAAASAPDFRYSSPLRESGIVWSREKLDEWLTSPSRMVPGTRMVQMVRDEDRRKAIIDYLETLR